jgi:hypothetical protein
MDEIAEQITLRRAKGSNTWVIEHDRLLEETHVEFRIVEGSTSVVTDVPANTSGARQLAGRAIRQLELIAQAGS